MRFFSKKTNKKQKQDANQAGAMPVSSSSNAELTASLSAETLRPEAQEILGNLSKKIKDQGIMRVASLSDAVQPDKPISDGMRNLLNTMSTKLFPHRHQTDAASTDAKALVENLREKLAQTPRKGITAPSDASSVNAQTVNMDQADADLSQNGQGKATSLQGETKPEHASPEALANPFSLVNINRGAASGNAISTGITSGTSNSTSKRRINSNTKVDGERTTVSYKKKLQQLRFSRRRFLRDYNGSHILAVIFVFILLVGFNGGTIFANVSVLIPQTKINQDAGKQALAFRNQIERDTPKLSGLLNQRQANNKRVNEALEAFATTTEIRNDFSAFINELDEDPRIEISEQTIVAETNDLPKVENITVSFKAKTNFLLWLQFRNKFIRRIGEINVIEETITAPPNVPTVDITIKMSRPGRST